MKSTLIPAEAKSGSGSSLILLPMREEAALVGEREAVPLADLHSPPLPADPHLVTLCPAGRHRHLPILAVLATRGAAFGAVPSRLLHQHRHLSLTHRLAQQETIIPPLITLPGKLIPTTNVEAEP